MGLGKGICVLLMPSRVFSPSQGTILWWISVFIEFFSKHFSMSRRKSYYNCVFCNNITSYMQGTIELSISSLHCINDPLNHNRKFQNSKHCLFYSWISAFWSSKTTVIHSSGAIRANCQRVKWTQPVEFDRKIFWLKWSPAHLPLFNPDWTETKQIPDEHWRAALNLFRTSSLYSCFGNFHRG